MVRFQLSVTIALLIAVCGRPGGAEPKPDNKQAPWGWTYISPGIMIESAGSAALEMEQRGIDHVTVAKAELLDKILILIKAVETNDLKEVNKLRKADYPEAVLTANISDLHQRRKDISWGINIHGVDKYGHVIFSLSASRPWKEGEHLGAGLLGYFAFERTPEGYRITNNDRVSEFFGGGH